MTAFGREMLPQMPLPPPWPLLLALSLHKPGAAVAAIETRSEHVGGRREKTEAWPASLCHFAYLLDRHNSEREQFQLARK